MLVGLIRPLNIILGIFSVLIIHSFLIFNFNTIFTMIVIFCFISSSNIINDIYDQKSDRINNREKINQKKIIYVYMFLIFLLISGIISAFQLNFYSKIISLIALPLIIVYTPIFKGKPLIGNLLVSLLVGLVFIFSEISMYNLINFSVLPFSFAFLVTFIREIIKDLEDIVGDKANSIKTFPVVFGEKNTIILSIYLMFLLNIIVLIPYLFSFYNLNYLLAVIIGVILPNSYCIIYFIKKRFQYNYKNIQNIQKTIIIMGLFIIYFMKNNF
jgi:4-hydroxybenzoate polyprenyltransferase